MNRATEKIVWHQTLAFKLFLLVSLILFLAVAAISLQNSRQFRDVLKRQSEDHLLLAAMTTAGQFQDNIDYWSSLGNAFGHMAAQLQTEQLKTAAQGFLASNQGLAAIHIIPVYGGVPNTSDFFLIRKSESSDASGRSLSGSEQQLLQLGRQFFKANSTTKSQTRVFFRNISRESNLPLIQIAVRLTKNLDANQRVNQSSDTWVILSIWRSTITTAFQTSKIFSSVLMNSLGQVVLQTNNDQGADLQAPVREQDLSPLGTNQIRSRAWTSENKLGEPVMVSAYKLSELNLFVVAQKLAKQDQNDIARQTKNTLLGSWILFLIALAACYAAASGLTNRILILVQSTWEIASGNLAIHLPERNKDEVGILARSVNKMAADIQSLLVVREVAVRQQAELKMAENIQKMLIPERHIKRNGIMTQSYFKPATECAGDWWGRFTLSDNKELVVLADATGHGAHAAIIASLAYSYFATVTKQMLDGKIKDISAIKMIRELNSVLYSAGHGQSTMTMLLLLFDTESNKVDALSAGHCPPFSIQAENSKIIAFSGGVLGSEEHISLEPKSFDIEVGQRFLIYTDGLFECRNSDTNLIKKKRLNDRLASWGALPFDWLFKSITELVEDHFKDSPLTDDITLVLVEYCGGDSSLDRKKIQDSAALLSNNTHNRIDAGGTGKSTVDDKDLSPVDPETQAWVL